MSQIPTFGHLPDRFKIADIQDHLGQAQQCAGLDRRCRARMARQGGHAVLVSAQGSVSLAQLQQQPDAMTMADFIARPARHPLLHLIKDACKFARLDMLLDQAVAARHHRNLYARIPLTIPGLEIVSPWKFHPF